MTELSKAYEIKGKGYDSVRDLCADLRSKLNVRGFNLLPSESCTNVDGVPATSNKAAGLVYLVNEQNNGVEIDVILNRSTVGEGESFFDFSFSKANVRPFGTVDTEKLQNTMVDVLYDKIMRVYFPKN